MNAKTNSASTASATPAGTCPCGSGLELAACCLPFIQGKKQPDTAEQLLRARYTAFTRGDVDYVMSTHHTRTRGDVKREEIAEWANGSEWHGLQIAQKEAGEAKDTEGTLIFCAKYKEKTTSPSASPSPPPSKKTAREPSELKASGDSGDIKDSGDSEDIKSHWEKSFFEKENGQWRFLDAQGVHVGTYRRPEPKTGRNDPCICGSGKKYKKCCAA